MTGVDVADQVAGVRTAPGYDRYRATGFFQNLNGLRFICISMVLWHHAPAVTGSDIQLLSRGFLGVDFFFVLSGFLITTLLLREADRDGQFSLKKFYIRRALRILPVYFFVVSAVAGYYIVWQGETQYLELLPFYYLFLSNFLYDHIPTLSITWSLSVEEQYYMLWPLLLLIIPGRYVVPALIAGIVLNVAGAMGVFGIGSVDLRLLNVRLPNSTYAPILIGSLVAVMLHRRAVFEAIFPVLGHPLSSVVTFAALVVWLEVSPGDVRGLPNLLIHVLMGLALMSIVVREDTVLSGFFTQPLVARMGEISYGIYLYHLVGLDITNRILDAAGLSFGWLTLFAYAAVSALIAEASFRTLEAYFRRFRPRSA